MHSDKQAWKNSIKRAVLGNTGRRTGTRQELMIACRNVPLGGGGERHTGASRGSRERQRGPVMGGGDQAGKQGYGGGVWDG